ncbi:MAG: HAMP domain-containing histidine kinase [Coriobacteriia bacterium]|nr:HAMP domain-containing histidine kinase [Coriobacteriia bacterium]MCL2871196.1 HAMP domain-containing histidine kinase [Coriobacteriia bacterium]
MLYFIIAIMSTLLLGLCARLIFLKREMRRLRRDLTEIMHLDTNIQLTSRSFDKELLAFVATVNEVLEKSRYNLFEKHRTEAALKRAITNISHDLRTPLTSARGYLQLIESSDLDAETKAQYLQVIQGRLEALSGLMDSLFEFARISEGNIVLSLQKVDMTSVVREVLSEAYPNFEKRGFEAAFTIPDTPILCVTDAELITRVVQNLVKNVYVHGKSHVHVRLDDEVLEIANWADRLDSLDVDQIFDRFYTFDASRSNKGTGLGLAIAKELTQQLGGQITASKEDDMLVMRVFLPK